MNILEEIQNCPVEWKELGEVAEVGTGNNNTNEQVENGKYPFYVRSKNIKTINTYLFDEEAIVIPGEGDIGKIFHYVKGKYGLHQRAYRIHITVDNIKTKFIYYYMHASFKSFIMKKAVSATVSSIRKPMIEKFPIPIPPLEIQEKIVQILDKMTEYVTELTSELTSRKKQYSFYRDKLLSFEDEVYQVEWKTLGEVATVTKLAGYEFTKYVNYSSTGEIIALRALNVKKGRLVLDDVKYIDNSEFSKLNRSKLQIGDMLFTYVGTVGEVALIDKDDTYYLAPNVAMVRLNTNTIIAKYLMYYCQSNVFVYNQIERLMEASSMKNLTMEKIRKFKIPIPSLEIQSRIVQVLDNFDKVCNDLNIGLPKEIELRQKQYEYFREKLLTFVAEGEYTDSTVQYRQDIIRLLNWVFGPIRVNLGQVINLQRGKRLVRNQLTSSGSFPVYQNSLTPLGYFTHSNRHKETSFVVCAGAAGEIGYSNLDFWAADDVYTLETSDNISDKFMYYVLLSKQDRLKSQVRKASIPRLSKDAIDKVAFYLPSLTEQERIVSILDNFNTLTNSLSEGLPKEIELRQKQYEYWREQLLKFTR